MNALDSFIEASHTLNQEASEVYLSTFRCFNILSEQEVNASINKMYDGQEALMLGLCKHRKTIDEGDFYTMWNISNSLVERAREIKKRWEEFKKASERIRQREIFESIDRPIK